MTEVATTTFVVREATVFGMTSDVGEDNQFSLGKTRLKGA
jgi:hypothetical protein